MANMPAITKSASVWLHIVLKFIPIMRGGGESFIFIFMPMLAGTRFVFLKLLLAHASPLSAL